MRPIASDSGNSSPPSEENPLEAPMPTTAEFERLMSLMYLMDESKEKETSYKMALEGSNMRNGDLTRIFHELDKKLREKQKEIEKLNEANLKCIKREEDEKEKKKEIDPFSGVEHIQCFNENQYLKWMIENKEEAEQLLKQEFKNLVDTNLQQKTRAEHQKSTPLVRMKKTTNVNQLESEFFKNDNQLQNPTSSKLPKETKPILPNKFGYTLQDFQFLKDSFDVDSLLKEAMENKELLISLTNIPSIQKMMNKEYQKYEKRLKEYQDIIEKNIELMKTPNGHLTHGYLLPSFPQLPQRLTVEFWAAVAKPKARVWLNSNDWE